MFGSERKSVIATNEIKKLLFIIFAIVFSKMKKKEKKWAHLL